MIGAAQNEQSLEPLHLRIPRLTFTNQEYNGRPSLMRCKYNKLVNERKEERKNFVQKLRDA
jgi:hypothetical protein